MRICITLHIALILQIDTLTTYSMFSTSTFCSCSHISSGMRVDFCSSFLPRDETFTVTISPTSSLKDAQATLVGRDR